MKTNVVYHGDNINVMEKIRDNSIDLIYIDPPFYTNRDFMDFKDIFNDMPSYIAYIGIRLVEMHKKLKETGSIYLHCDWHANHHLRRSLDDIFGANNFVNEIIWSYRTGGNNPKRSFSKKHDTIFWYSKSKNYLFFNKTKEKIYLNHKYGFSSIKVFEEENPTCKAKDKCKIFYKESSLRDVWEIKALVGKENGSNVNKERIGYPTQKPLALLDRIIKASTKEGDIVADFFCGSGTTLVAAKQLGRRYIGCDMNENAVNISKERLANPLDPIKATKST